MTRPTDWLLDPVKAPTPTPPPVVTPQPAPQPAPPRSSNLATIIITVALTIIAMRAVEKWPFTPDDRDDDRSVVIDDKGRYAVILVDDTRQDEMTDGQSAAANWSGVLEYAKDHGITYRRFDAKNVDTEAERQLIEKPLRQCVVNALSPPSLTIAVDGKLTTEELPDGIDALRRRLDAIK